MSKGVTLDLSQWTNDNHYFNRVINKHAEFDKKEDGTVSDEKVLK